MVVSLLISMTIPLSHSQKSLFGKLLRWKPFFATCNEKIQQRNGTFQGKERAVLTLKEDQAADLTKIAAHYKRDTTDSTIFFKKNISVGGFGAGQLKI